MPESALQKIVESLNQDLEEKIYQLSQVRQVAETVFRGIHETQYYSHICSEFISIFDAAVCGLFWQRHRQPRSWWLDAWAASGDDIKPSQQSILEESEGILGWIKRLRKPHYMEDAQGEALLKMWEAPVQLGPSAAIIPIGESSHRMGMLVLIDPIFKLSTRSVQLQLEILTSLIASGVHNRLLYKELHESEEEFRDLFENSSDMVVVVYPDGVIRECNTIFKEKLGLDFYPAGRELTELISEDLEPNFSRCWDDLRSGKPVQNVDINLKGPDNEDIQVELSGNVRLDENGNPTLARLYLRDVTQRRESERRQRELELEIELVRERQLAQVGLYVSGIAHNLQNPVQVLLGYIELLRFKGVNIPELNIIEKSTQSIMQIIRNLLDKMQKERNPETTDVNLNELLDNELTFLNANTFFKHEITKNFKYGENIPTIRGVYSDFSQAIMNIVYNALDAMRDSEIKELTVESEFIEDSREICMSIADTGEGISEDSKEQIFDPFFTTKKNVRAENTGLSSGSGLGLSSARTLMKAYNGHISFESTPGKGTKFTIIIPVKDSGENA